MVLNKHAQIVTCNREHDGICAFMQRTYKAPEQLHVVLFHFFSVFSPECFVLVDRRPGQCTAKNLEMITARALLLTGGAQRGHFPCYLCCSNFAAVHVKGAHACKFLLQDFCQCKEVVTDISIAPTFQTQLLQGTHKPSANHLSPQSAAVLLRSQVAKQS